MNTGKITQLMQAFDATTVDPSQSSGQLPVGKHKVQIVDSEIKNNKDNTGAYLELKLSVLEGPSQGVSGGYRLNIYHNNQQTVEIARKQLSAVCHVTGVFNIQDSTQLHGIPFYVEVGMQKNNNEYTEVKKVFDINGNEPGKQGQAPAQAQPAQAQGGWGQQPAQNAQPQQAGWGQQQPAQQPEAQPAQNAWNQQQQAQPSQTGWAQPQAQPAQAQPAQAAPWGQGQGQVPAQAPWGQK